MKVFLYYSGFGNTGGITTQLACYAQLLLEEGHEVTIGGLGQPWWRSVSKQVEGANYIGGPYLPKRRWFRKWGLDSPEVQCARVIEHLRNNSYDIVHCEGWDATNIYVYWAGLVNGAKTLYTASSTAEKRYPADFEKCGLLLDGVHGTARCTAEVIKERMHCDGQCYVFLNGSNKLWEPVDRLPENPHSLGFIGHLEDHKQIDRLIRVWAHVVSKLNGAHLHLFGSGSREASLRKQIQQLGLEQNITFHGYVSDLEKVFSQFSSLILMAKEGMSNVAMETLCAGRSLILPNDGCFPEIYGQCSAVSMFPPDATDVDIADIVAETIADGLDDTTRTAAREYYEQRFSPKVIANQLIDCYKDLLSR
jgi:glycosyltransferase involved in cell wall biosynthesis